MNDVSFSAIARRVANANPDVASYRALADEMLHEVEGYETELLAKLLPGYIRAVLSRRAQVGTDEEIWQAFLSERMPTRDRGTIFTRDATKTEVRDAVERRRRFAGNLDRRAFQLERVAEQMEVEGARTVAAVKNTTDLLAIAEHRLLQIHAERATAEKRARSLLGLQRSKEMVEGWIAARDTPVLQALRSQRDHLK